MKKLQTFRLTLLTPLQIDLKTGSFFTGAHKDEPKRPARLLADVVALIFHCGAQSLDRAMITLESECRRSVCFDLVVVILKSADQRLYRSVVALEAPTPTPLSLEHAIRRGGIRQGLD